MTVPAKLRALRIRSGLSMERVAKRLGFSRAIRPDAVGAETIEIIGVVVGKFETVPVSPIQART